MNKSDSIAALAVALSKAQGEMTTAKKDADNPYFKSKYADLASVWEACRAPLAKYGLSVCQMPEYVDGYVFVQTILMHASGEWISSELRLKPVKDDPQGMGSAITYARRYALSAAVGIAPEDDDGNQASGKPSKAPQSDTLLTDLEKSVAMKAFSKPQDTERGAGASVRSGGPAQSSTSVGSDVKAAVSSSKLNDAQKSIVEEKLKDGEFIGPGEQANFARRFAEALPKEFAKQVEELRHQWLARHGFIDKDGNPSSKMIPTAEFEAVKVDAMRWARTYSGTKSA